MGFITSFVSKTDFIEHTERFIQIFEKICGSTIVKIELYARVPFFSSFVGSDEEMERQKRNNEEGMQMLAELSELPEDFSAIPYARVLLHPRDETKAPRSAFGVVDFGSKLSSHIIFYAQPDEVKKVMEEKLFPNNDAPKGFTLGDGYE